MTKRVLHLSDLHFGRVNAPALEALCEIVLARKAELDLIVVTGDWTQRARTVEFRAAIEFVSQLSCPVVSVPGNHDVPLYDLPRRLLAPYSRYAKMQSTTISDYQDEFLSVVGLSTVNPFRVDSGHVHQTDIDRTHAFFSKAAPNALKIIACHHPLFDPREMRWLRPEYRAKRLLDTGADVVLSGHSHVQWVQQSDELGRAILHISAGTSISSRLREEVNGFHVIELETEVSKRPGVLVKTYDLTKTGFLERDRPSQRFTF